MAAAKVARVDEFARNLPDGYDTWVGERGVTLSGGQKQRVAIARTLLLNPRILILDDSTSSVDMETEYLIQQALEAVMQGRTTFVVASRLRTIKNADQILVLDNGRIVERGTHETLLPQGGIYTQLYDLQLREQEEFETSRLSTQSENGDASRAADDLPPTYRNKNRRWPDECKSYHSTRQRCADTSSGAKTAWNGTMRTSQRNLIGSSSGNLCRISVATKAPPSLAWCFMLLYTGLQPGEPLPYRRRD